MPPALPVHPEQSGPNKAKQLIEIAERQGWLTWDPNQPIANPATPDRRYRVHVAGQIHLLAVDEVPGFVFGVAATHGPKAVNLIRYRPDMTEKG